MTKSFDFVGSVTNTQLILVYITWVISYKIVQHSIFNEGLSYDNMSKRYGYPYEAIMSIARAFEENGQWVPKPKGGVHYPILQDVHIH